MRRRRLKLYEFVSDVVDAGSTVLLAAELGLDADRARALSIQVAKAICERHAKSTVYIPEAVNLANIERNARIWAAYQVDGGPPTFARRFSPARAQELSLEHDLSTQQIYNIIAAQRAMELEQLQPELPGMDSPQ